MIDVSFKDKISISSKLKGKVTKFTELKQKNDISYYIFYFFHQTFCK